MAIVTIQPKGPLHVGQFVGIEREAALDYVPSDTLFGALVEAWKQLGRDVPALLEPFKSNAPPFLISSAFPRAAQVRFYPRPWVAPNPPHILPGKQAKKVRWVSEGIFNRLIAGESIGSDEVCLLQDGAVWVLPHERESLAQKIDLERSKLWQTQIVPRVTVGRAANRSNLFHAGRMMFADGAGLWFAVTDLTGLGNLSGLQEALAVLADNGLGGLRSAGHGAFEWTWENDPHPSPSPAGGGGSGWGYAVTLARYAPRHPDEIGYTLKAEYAAYQLTLVGGWCRDDGLHPWRRKSVRMITEGSLLGMNGQLTYGQLVDVTPDGVSAFDEQRRVYRYGFAFPVAVTADVSSQEAQ